MYIIHVFLYLEKKKKKKCSIRSYRGNKKKIGPLRGGPLSTDFNRPERRRRRRRRCRSEIYFFPFERKKKYSKMVFGPQTWSVQGTVQQQNQKEREREKRDTQENTPSTIVPSSCVIPITDAQSTRWGALTTTTTHKRVSEHKRVLIGS
jgi:hypothetical protein